MPAGPPGHWLDGARIRAYAIIAIAVYVVTAVAWVAMSQDLVDPRGKPLGYDFITFWAASFLALAGEPANAYGLDHILAAEQAAVPTLWAIYLWHYPPTFFLVVLPFVLLPYLAAYAVFQLATFACLAVVIRRILPGGLVLLALVALPGTYVNAFHGQNGFLTGAFLGLALVLLDRRPVVAGIVIGLLALKPHWGILLPVLLVATRAWPAFIAAAITATAFLVVSTAVLGVETLEAFVANLPLVRRLYETGALPWAKMPTVFAAVSLAGGGLVAAYAAQITAALAAFAATVWICLRPVPTALKGAFVVVATILMLPYMFDYDLTALAVPIALLVAEGLRSGFRPGEREMLIAVASLPLLATLIAEATGIQIGALVLAAFAVTILRRAAATPAA
ncbi:MAG: DUF2029 domain-containing protein [Alphaproteobacteria bacterium]|nr:DUF2029 domain-containing protein [Alphaproteobacteria bacterium]